MAYIKTRKTGSSTVTNIMYRLVLFTDKSSHYFNRFEVRSSAHITRNAFSNVNVKPSILASCLVIGMVILTKEFHVFVYFRVALKRKLNVLLYTDGFHPIHQYLYEHSLKKNFNMVLLF